MRTTPYGSWFAPTVPRPDPQLRLVCLPYAGGGALIFRRWADVLPPEVEVVPVQLPGREWRLRERPFNRLDAMVDALVSEWDRIEGPPFAIFGHSMGALVGFELARALRREGRTGPQHLIVSGHSAPQLLDRSDRHLLGASDEEFVDRLRNLSGTPPEILENRELMDILLPVLRADFELCDTYHHAPDAPLECPLTALAGLDDPLVPPDRMEPWAEHTAASFSLRVLPGGHFFINESTDLVLRAVLHTLFGR